MKRSKVKVEMIGPFNAHAGTKCAINDELMAIALNPRCIHHIRKTGTCSSNVLGQHVVASK